MADPNEKTIGGNSAPTGNTDKTIGSNRSDTTESTPPNNKYSDSVGNKTPQSPNPFGADLDLKGKLRNATLQGGLTAIPEDFIAKGSWETIKSADPFEKLYLDYTKYQKITDEMVFKNHQLLYEFWNNKKLLNSRPRETAEEKYGKDLIATACDQLDIAKKKIGTPAGRERYFKENTEKRIAVGIKAIEEPVDFALEGGEFTKTKWIKILNKGLANHLKEEEIKNYVERTLNDRKFKPRSLKQHLDFFENKWMTDEAWKTSQQRVTKWLDAEVSSLEEVGEVSFNNKEKANDRISKPGLLTTVITQLTNDAEVGYIYTKMIESEPDIDKRFLKVVYHLNPTLPYKLYNQSFTSISALLQKTASDYGLFLAASNDYKKGYLHIWLQETDTANAAKLTSGFDYNSFLNFVFKINPAHGIYLGQEKFGIPEQLIAKAKTDKAYWPKITEAMQAGVLPEWFTGIGRKNWLGLYNASLEQILDDSLYSEEEKKLAAVQTLIQVIDKSVANPEIKAVPTSIKLPALEGSKTVQEKIHLSLANFGFVKAKIILKQMVAGIELSGKTAVFFSLGGSTTTDLFLQVNPLKLLKDKTYTLEIEVQTAFQKITIPVEIKVVFPKKAYYVSMAKYAVFGALLFGIIRLITGAIAETRDWLSTINRIRPNSYREFLPDNYFFYFIALVLLVGSLVVSVFLIRKIEKI